MNKQPGLYNDRLVNHPVPFLDRREIKSQNYSPMFYNSSLWKRWAEKMIQIEVLFMGGAAWINVEKSQIVK